MTTGAIADGGRVPARAQAVVATVAICALALWVGGLVVLGACVAPIVFRIVPAPFAGDAMGTVFHRFDALAIACGVVVLACEALRIALPGARSSHADTARGATAALMVAAAIYQGMVVSPGILAFHAAGAIRGLGEDGLSLERLHALAETLAQVEVALGFAALALQVLTLRPRADSSAPPDAASSLAKEVKEMEEKS